MSFTAKVIATSEFFDVTTDLGPAKDRNRDAHPPLDPNTFYLGHYFPNSKSGSSQYVEFSEVTSKIFKGDELEEVTGDIRLIPLR
ncbi:MAG: hypothetical protein ABSA39_20155 [Edaphobacter sp.]